MWSWCCANVSVPSQDVCPWTSLDTLFEQCSDIVEPPWVQKMFSVLILYIYMLHDLLYTFCSVWSLYVLPVTEGNRPTVNDSPVTVLSPRSQIHRNQTDSLYRRERDVTMAR